MNGETAFFAVLLGIPALAFIGIGLVISAFVSGKRGITKAGKVRAVIGGVLTIACTVMFLVLMR